MQAMIYRAYRAPDVLQLTTVTKPVPGPGEVLVQVHAASLNQADDMRPDVKADLLLTQRADTF